MKPLLLLEKDNGVIYKMATWCRHSYLIQLKLLRHRQQSRDIMTYYNAVLC